MKIQKFRLNKILKRRLLLWLGFCCWSQDQTTARLGEHQQGHKKFKIWI